YVRRLDAVDLEQLGRMYAEMARQTTEVVRESAVAGEIHVTRTADARYVGQGYELTVPVPSGELDAAALDRVRAAFDEDYAATYGVRRPRRPRDNGPDHPRRHLGRAPVDLGRDRDDGP